MREIKRTHILQLLKEGKLKVFGKTKKNKTRRTTIPDGEWEKFVELLNLQNNLQC